MRSPYGHFSRDGKTYVITSPDTPRPWVNFLTNGRYAALCSYRGGGFSFHLDHRYHSILRRGPQLTYEDVPGRLLYIKDLDSGELWTANVTPFGTCTRFEARHEAGCTEIDSEYAGIASALRFFVPWHVDAEIWQLRLTNRSGRPRRLAVTALAEFVLGNVSLEDHEAAFMALFNDSVIGRQHLEFVKNWWHPHFGWSEENGTWKHRAVFSSVQPFSSAMTDREAFFGPFRNHGNPRALETEGLSGGEPTGQPLVGAMQWIVDLAPEAEWSNDLSITLVPREARAAEDPLVQRLQTSGEADRLLAESRAAWEELFARVRIQTPDPALNGMVNHWAKLQTFVTFSHGRGPSYYHKGQYRGMRDACQDTYGFNILSPGLARENILRIASFFFRDGRSAGGCNLIGLPEGPADKADLPLWIILTVADYLRETGDDSVLDERLPLLDGGESTVLEKMRAGVDRMLDQKGPHGLPLIGKGDWNDAVNAIGAGGKGESVWLAQFLIFIIGELAPILESRGDHDTVARHRTRAAVLRDIINEQCWDGEWFTRAFKDDGTPVGVRGQKEGFLWINSQTWAVLSGCAEPDRLNACMDAVEKHLGTAHGLMNLGPAYSEIDESIGIITRFRPGWKENGGVFSHASAFNIVARARLGRGADAVDLFKRLLPGGKDPDLYKMEPYVFSQFVAGPDDERAHGQGAFHWLTGTAAWMLRAMTDYILGVRAEAGGLRIDPSVAPDWKEFSCRREFRGATFEIHFCNPDGVQSGVRSVTLDGTPLSENLVPGQEPGTTHRVEVVMGR
jgi:cellobiose phosphorylase